MIFGNRPNLMNGHPKQGANMMKHLFVPALTFMLLFACRSIPENVEAIQDFDADAYLGKWYEIARLDHRFERGLDAVTATYLSGPDRDITVVNRGFDTKKERWKEIRGRAQLRSTDGSGHLTVTFFRPFRAAYNVIYMSENRDQAIVCGSSRNYLWVLSRQPKVSDQDLLKLMAFIESKGFDAKSLLFPDQKLNIRQNE